ncbi:MAG: AraC family transcriptional regulator [Rhodobacteraceae bacterium]|nr:AraC family transcriptional regulator [Paracoccaceae bacterium]
MLALPISLIFSLILLFLLASLRARGPVVAGLVLLVAANVLQGAVNAGAQYYGIAAMRAVQPVSAMLVPPAAWLALVTAGLDRALRPRDVLHLVGPALALICGFALRDALDALIPAAYLGYGLAILLVLRRAGHALPRARLSAGGRPALLWAAIAAGLMLSAASDLVIVAVQLAGRTDLQPLIVSITGSLVLLGLGLLGISMQDDTGPSAEEAAPTGPSEDDADLFARLDAHMTSRRPWTDPDLTLGQLARRLHVPVKQLSSAVNRCSGENISRYVNAHRVRAACEALRSGASVTTAMLDAGFATKSNFNREFNRVTGMAPSEWQASAAFGPVQRP